MKKILFLLLVMFLIIVIYISMNKKNKNYLILGITDNIERKGTNNYNTKFVNNNYRITDLLNDIKNRKQIDNRTILNYIIKADYIIINIGYNDFNSVKDDEIDIINAILDDLEALMNNIRLYSKEQIKYYSFEIDNNHKDYIYKRIKKICDKYSVLYIE